MPAYTSGGDIDGGDVYRKLQEEAQKKKLEMAIEQTEQSRSNKAMLYLAIGAVVLFFLMKK